MSGVVGVGELPASFVGVSAVGVAAAGGRGCVVAAGGQGGVAAAGGQGGVAAAGGRGGVAAAWEGCEMAWVGSLLLVRLLNSLSTG